MGKSRRDPGFSGSSVHAPVLVREVLRYLDPQPQQTIVDGTVGAAGHASRILDAIGPDGTLIGLDRDPMMLHFAAQRLDQPNCHLIQDSYANLSEHLGQLGHEAVDGILLDLGLSSDQLADEERGFGFDAGGPLDLRFDPTSGRPASELLQRVDVDELTRILQDFGEERFARRIAEQIIQRRSSRPIRTASDLVETVSNALPKAARGSSRKHPATRVFQALRIAVNDELAQLRIALDSVLFDCLRPGGRAVVISFHSLEDRMVKDAFRDTDRWQNLTRKPAVAAPAETRMNPRARTAKLRAAMKP